MKTLKVGLMVVLAAASVSAFAKAPAKTMKMAKPAGHTTAKHSPKMAAKPVKTAGKKGTTLKMKGTPTKK